MFCVIAVLELLSFFHGTYSSGIEIILLPTLYMSAFPLDTELFESLRHYRKQNGGKGLAGGKRVATFLV